LELGTRTIRSAGQGSGSIEVTLPSTLRDLTGLPCRIALRDGLRPEIVLAPDLRPAREALVGLWALLGSAFATTLGALPLAEIGIAMQPDARLERLCWADALLLLGPVPHAAEPLCRVLRCLALAAASGLGLSDVTAAGFAASVAFAVTGIVPLPADQEACDLVTALAAVPADGLLDDDVFAPLLWQQAAPVLMRVLELHQDFTAHPERLAALRRAWRQGVALELTGD
jgi:hypothetical protein